MQRTIISLVTAALVALIGTSCIAGKDGSAKIAPFAMIQDRSGLGDAGDMTGGGVYATWREKDAKIASEVSIAYTGGSEDDFDAGPLGTFDIDTQSQEIALGARYDFGTAAGVTPFFGAGALIQRAEADGGGDDDEDVSFGGYAQLGIDWQVTQRIGIMIAGRYGNGTDFELGDEDVSAEHVAGILGITFSP